MQLEEAIQLIRHCAEQMNVRYQRTVFDEWAIVSLADGRARVIHYMGPRAAEFEQHFNRDAGALREGLQSQRYDAGDFEFARQAAGTNFESFMVMGKGHYLICNNTWATMDAIAKNPLWLAAQVPFVELSEKVRSSPLAGVV
jgi:hypothetical protein